MFCKSSLKYNKDDDDVQYLSFDTVCITDTTIKF